MMNCRHSENLWVLGGGDHDAAHNYLGTDSRNQKPSERNLEVTSRVRGYALIENIMFAIDI